MRPLSRSPYGRKCKPFLLKTIKDWVRRADRAVKPKPSCVDCCLHRTARRCSRPLRENRAARGIAITSQRGIGALARAQAALAAPEVVQSVWQRAQAATPNIEEPVVVLALRNLSTLWTQLFPAEQQRIVQLLIERVQLREEGIDIQWRESGWQQWAGELTAG